jgi:poly-gamma-glutamate biosynthesis protein PgsC/CapC
VNPEIYLVAGIILGLLFTELTGLSPGGVIVPGYLAMFLHRPLEIVFTVAAAAVVMLSVMLLSRLFFLFGRRRYVLCLLLGMIFKLAIEYLPLGGLPAQAAGIDLRLIGWLIPGIMAYDMYKQGIPRTLLAAGTVTAIVFLLAQGWMAIDFS